MAIIFTVFIAQLSINQKLYILFEYKVIMIYGKCIKKNTFLFPVLSPQSLFV